MEIFPISCESLGTRSFAHFVMTDDINILIDPSVSLAPVRFQLLPHPLEVAISWLSRQTLLDLIDLTDVLIQTHYHGDHFTLGERRIYEFTDRNTFNRIYSSKLQILAKDPEKNLNYNQQKRAQWLWKKKDININIADSKEFQFGDTSVRFSKAVPHGYDTERGCVVETLIKDSNFSYLFSSDVSGPATKEAVSFIIENNPDLIVLDGPSTYHPNVLEAEIRASFEGLKEISDNFPRIFIDHHFLRTTDWQEILKKEIGKVLPTFSQLRNQEPLLLEAKRKELYKEISFPRDFHSKFQYQGYSIEYFKELLKKQKYDNYWIELRKDIENNKQTKSN